MAALSLAPRALYEEVAELLRQRIFQRELEPGSWIDEMKLAEEYGISRTPLREALKVLAAEGLVTMKVRRGAYVTEVSDKRPGRGVPPALAAGKRCRRRGGRSRRPTRDRRNCRPCTRSWKRAAQNRDEFFAVNERFHMRLLEIAGNRWRNQMVADLRKVMKLNRHNSLLKSGRIEESLARAPRGDGRAGRARCAVRAQAHAGALQQRAGSRGLSNVPLSCGLDPQSMRRLRSRRMELDPGQARHDNCPSLAACADTRASPIRTPQSPSAPARGSAHGRHACPRRCSPPPGSPGAGPRRTRR